MARRDFIQNLEYSLENITGEMVTFADHTSRFSEQFKWNQASIRVPENFEGGYSFSVHIGDSKPYTHPEIKPKNQFTDFY